MNWKKLAYFFLRSSCLWIILLGIIALGVIFRTTSSHQNNSFIILSGAKKVQYNKFNRQVTYELAEKYPAKAALKELSDKLANNGWRPLREDYLNPGMPSSHVKGWFFVTSTSEHGPCFRDWRAQWKSSKGEIIEYNLKYFTPANTTESKDRLIITANYLSRKLTK